MGIVGSSVVQLGYVAEDSWGVTPTTPAFQILRFLAPENFKVDRENIVSSEQRADRNVTDLIQVSGGASGGFGFELSYGTYDAIFESAMQSAWSENVLKNGSTVKSFTFERKVPLDTPEYFRFLGMVCNSFSLSCRAKEIVSGSFEFLGKGGTLTTGAVASSTYVDATTTDVMNAAADFAAFSVGGLSGIHVLGVDINATNNLRAPVAAGSVNALGIGSGRFEVSGSMDVYFESGTLFNTYLAGTSVALALTIGRTAGSKYTISIPRLKFESGNTDIGGNDEDVMANLTWRGLYDGTAECTLSITRAVA